jgi:hypothetical protein
LWPEQEKGLRFPDKGLEFLRELENPTYECRLSIGGLYAPGAAKPWERTVPSRFVFTQDRIRDTSFIASPLNTFSPAQKFQIRMRLNIRNAGTI